VEELVAEQGFLLLVLAVIFCFILVAAALMMEIFISKIQVQAILYTAKQPHREAAHYN
jgi:hypothetical protein